MFKVKLSGIEEYLQKLQSSFSDKFLHPKLAKSTKELADLLESRISARYNAKGLTSQKPKISATIKSGDKYFKNISYEASVQNAGIFITNRVIGNIEPKKGKKRKGVVHYVTIKVGKEKISYGKYGLGGFSILRGGKRFLLTRTSKSRYPITGIIGLSKAEMAISIQKDKEYRKLREEIVRKYFK